MEGTNKEIRQIVKISAGYKEEKDKKVLRNKQIEESEKQKREDRVGIARNRNGWVTNINVSVSTEGRSKKIAQEIL